jgi:hypothetical protein
MLTCSRAQNMEKHNREKDKELTDVHEPEEARSKC